MSNRIVLAVLLVVSPAQARPIGMYVGGGLGTALNGPGALDGGFGGHVALGLRGRHWGGELGGISAELHDDTGTYQAVTPAILVTVRHVVDRHEMDSGFARWFEFHAKAGPSWTWINGDAAAGPPDRTSGFGFVIGGGVRWVFGGLGVSADVTMVRMRLHKDATHDVRDELGLRDAPAVDLAGDVVLATLGFGFVL